MKLVLASFIKGSFLKQPCKNAAASWKWRRFSDDRGVAAVEFALILPLMLLIYIGTAELVNTLLAARKTALVARAVSDLASQKVDCSDTSLTGVKVCLSSDDIIQTFSAASAIFSPYAADVSNLKMTMSQVTLKKNAAGTAIYAYVDWSATWGPNSIQRGCNGLGVKETPSSKYQPLLLADVKPGSTDYQKKFPASLATSDTSLGSSIVADVSYAYTPSFGFTYTNSGSSSITNKQMQIMRNRADGAPITVTSRMIASIPAINVSVCPP